MKWVKSSVPDEAADKVRGAADAGGVSNVPAYFSRPTQQEPDWALARTIVAEMAMKAGGVTEDDIAWAEQTLGFWN